jgi:hypothetical protein
MMTTFMGTTIVTDIVKVNNVNITNIDTYSYSVIIAVAAESWLEIEIKCWHHFIISSIKYHQPKIVYKQRHCRDQPNSSGLTTMSVILKTGKLDLRKYSK